MHATLPQAATHVEIWGTAWSIRPSTASVNVNSKTKNVSDHLRMGFR